ncbi:MAG: hypothetical protein ABIN83_01655, partial [Sphingomicrobium sp.]
MGRIIALQTAVSGSLDIVFAMMLTLLFGRQIGDMLRTVASGPFPAATHMGSGGALLGLAVHFALMAIMAAIFMAMVNHRPALLDAPWRTGIVFGLITYVAMNLIVVQLRFHPPFPPKPLSIATQLFAHIVLVGIPFALIAAR